MPSPLEEKVKKLSDACHAAFKANKTSCSHAVWDVIKAVHDDKHTYRQANELVDWMKTNWTSVTLDSALQAANSGAVVVGGKKEDSNGHVVVVFPGDKIKNGGYQYLWKKKNKYLILEGKGLYPRCLSTSQGSWPGALSDGDKTVWDPWANDEKFKLVGFWTPKWPL
jgi:hypothetical protein